MIFFVKLLVSKDQTIKIYLCSKMHLVKTACRIRVLHMQINLFVPSLFLFHHLSSYRAITKRS